MTETKTRIKKLGEACDKAIDTLSKVMDGKINGSHEDVHVRRQAAIDVVHAYFDHSGRPQPRN